LDNKDNGILQYGKFNEGYCLKISLRDPSKTIYVICTETERDKDIIFRKVRALKIKDQHTHGIFKFLHSNPNEKKGETISDLFGSKKKIKEDPTGVKDGYWLTLQEWSQCSKKCDHGTSTYQRMCIPPKNGGKPCQGEAILVKPCNPQPCPKVTGTNEDLKNRENTVINKPIVKIMRFTNTPQRYTLCKIKESDMMIFDDGTDPIKQNEPLFQGKDINAIGGIKIPSRVIMNLKTLSIYSGDKFETLYMSFLLEKTKFYKLKNKKNCFKLYETASRYTTLCPFNSDVSGKELEEWETDFFTFRDKCKAPELQNEEERKALEDKIKAEMEKARQQAIEEANESRKKKIATKENDDIASQVQVTQKIALKAIEKESLIEELIKKEAEEKNRQEEIRIRKEIEMEKNKQKCVAKAIKEKKLENEMVEKAKEIQEAIATIKKEAATQVILKRNKLKKMIDQINKKAELKRNKLRSELQQVRMTTANEVGNAYKKGDSAKCIKANAKPKARNDYCIATFSDDFAQLNYCRTTDNFCETCCNAEFGEMLSNLKEECIKKVCPSKEQDKKDDKEEDSNRNISDDLKKGFIKQKPILID